MHAIKDAFEAYDWRRMQAALRQVGWVVNHKKVKRLMREYGLHPVLGRRFATTAGSDHDQPVFPDRTRELARKPNRLLGGRPHLCRDRLGLRLRRADHGRLVAPHRRLPHLPQDRRPHPMRRPWLAAPAANGLMVAPRLWGSTRYPAKKHPGTVDRHSKTAFRRGLSDDGHRALVYFDRISRTNHAAASIRGLVARCVS
ncbi:MAG: transposase [Bauldia sp.]|nr:transposase [Bauldia sp.]